MAKYLVIAADGTKVVRERNEVRLSDSVLAVLPRA